jgi:putative holliday junction resolvase
MARILSVDFGMKRCGFAETDDLQIIASPLSTVDTKVALDFIKDYISKYEVETIVVGDPRRWDDSETHATRPANEFCEKLTKLFPHIPIAREDESFTSKMAMQTMIDGGMKKKDRRVKGNLDKISAAIILQSYMRRRELNP